MNNSFSKDKWSNIDLEKWQKEQYEKNKKNNPVLKLIELENEYIKKNTSDGILKSIPFAVKDNIAINNETTTAGTKILEGYCPTFTATIIDLLIKEGAIPIYKTNLDELAMGGTGLESRYGDVRNIYDEERIVGGSSSGSVYSVASGMVPFALGTDTGDSIRMPAAYAGVVGFKPTWGIVSRYGVYDFAPTWDTIGFLTKTVSEQAILLDITSKTDEKDASSIPSEQKDFFKNIKTDKKIKFGYWKEIIDKSQPYIVDKWNLLIKELEKNGHEVIELKPDIELLKTTLPVYKTISSIEAFSTNSNLTGFLFGKNFNEKDGTYEDKIRNARTKGFGYEVKKRFLFAQQGILNHKMIYKKAQKLRSLIIKEIENQLNQVDALLNIAAPNIAHKINKFYDGDILANSYLGMFNANGSPSITVPYKEENSMPIGFNIATKPFMDLECLQCAKIVEDNLEKI